MIPVLLEFLRIFITNDSNFYFERKKKIIKLSRKCTFYFKTITQLWSATNDEDLFGHFLLSLGLKIPKFSVTQK